MSYKITPYTLAQADKLGVVVKPSKVNGKKIDVFKKYYEERGVSLLESLLKETGLNFTNKRIDVFVVDAIQKSMSAPLILSAHHGKEFFLQELLHELVHVLMGDNHSIVPKLHDNKTVNSHIYVFYFLRKIGIDEKPKTKDYIEAWELSKNCEDLRLLFKKQKEELGL